MNINSTTEYVDRRSVIALAYMGGRPATPQISPEPPEWTFDALCAQIGVDLFFPDPAGNHAAEAKRICGMCPVAAQCLEWALRIEANEPESFGIYGGMAPRQRRKIITRRRAAA